MDELQNYVNRLFLKYNNSQEIKDLKEEILSNLAAKKADLMSEGMSEAEATEKAKGSILNIDGLIDGNINIYQYQFKLDVMQRILIYSAIALNLLIPLSFLRSTFILNLFFLLTIVITGILYLAERNGQNRYQNATAYIMLSNLKKIKNYAWMIWSIYIGLNFLKSTGLYFGSNLWFHRKIEIDGPYEFASIASAYLAPLATIAIPLLLHHLPKLACKYEVSTEKSSGTEV